MYSYGNMISPSNRLFSGGGGDADASAFITTASITDGTQQSAINQLVLDLKSYSIWSKLEAIYPYVGGNATSHSYNLKDTTQFQITWSGGVTHDANGITGNGTNAYGNTNFVDSTHLTDFISFGAYSRTNSQSSVFDMGVSGSAGNILGCKFDGLGVYAVAMDGWTQRQVTATSLGLFSANRSDASNRALYINGTEYTYSKSSAGYSGKDMYVLARNNNDSAVDFYSARNLAFAFIGNSLTATEHANLNTAILDFQTTLSRNV